jgi:hypothetical protein
VFGERHLRHLLRSYATYYNEARTHLSVNKDAPKPRTGSHCAYAISWRTPSSVCACLISDRHRELCLLLGVSGERPRSCRAADQCDELAPLHYQPQAREMASQLFKQVR